VVQYNANQGQRANHIIIITTTNIEQQSKQSVAATNQQLTSMMHSYAILSTIADMCSTMRL
jgi:hypothetical protein